MIKPSSTSLRTEGVVFCVGVKQSVVMQKLIKRRFEVSVRGLPKLSISMHGILFGEPAVTIVK